jgi:glutaredoxin
MTNNTNTLRQRNVEYFKRALESYFEKNSFLTDSANKIVVIFKNNDCKWCKEALMLAADSLKNYSVFYVQYPTTEKNSQHPQWLGVPHIFYNNEFFVGVYEFKKNLKTHLV